VSALLPAFDPARVYAIDKASAEICRDMQIAGFSFDAERAKEISALLREEEAKAKVRADDAVGRIIKPTKTGGFSNDDLAAAFFKDLGAPVYFRSVLTGKPSLGVDTLRAYAASAHPGLRGLALAVLEWRKARKVRSTYVDAVVLDPDGRVHPTWLSYGTVTGRWSCKDPNLMNLIRRENDPTAVHFKGGIRSLYQARKGYVLVIFDKKQLEMRVAAYVSGDKAMIAACEAEDLHTANAMVLFAEQWAVCDADARKALRSLTKNAGFAVCYLAGAETVHTRAVASGVNVKLRQVEALIDKLQRGFAGYYRYQAEELLKIIASGYVYSPIVRRRRWLGHTPEPPEAANHPIQSGAADIMNLGLPPLVTRVRFASPKTRMVAQVHDSCVFEVPAKDESIVKELCFEAAEEEIEIATSGEVLRAKFPIDLEVTERWK
jgi:DNA polymerase-1